MESPPPAPRKRSRMHTTPESPFDHVSFDKTRSLGFSISPEAMAIARATANAELFAKVERLVLRELEKLRNELLH